MKKPIYPLLEKLPACKIDDINRAFEYMDEWESLFAKPITIEDFWNTHPHFSGGESDVILRSWHAARGGVKHAARRLVRHIFGKEVTCQRR